ncbi:MAG: GBS Bsp-like repeat-containing protein [Ruminococcus sp.]|nr:GBS Bsp-like repeat-containing protein [Ruminococcus sp.]
MSKKLFKKETIIFISFIMLVTIFSALPISNFNVLAISCRKDSFDKSRYILTGNMADDVATIAKSQKGRTGAQFGYTEAWCDEFVADCLENAGADSSIVGHGGTCIVTGIIADQASPDVAGIVGVGGNHRFNVTLNLNVTGNHSFYAYAINRGGGDNNPQLNGHFNTYIYEKTNSVISDVYISSMTPSGYTVNIAVNDESKVGRIAVPVWTTGNAATDSEAQDDLASDWQERCLAKKIVENTYAYYVNTSDHNNESGDYNNDVYVYNQNGELIDRWCYETNHRTHADVPSEKVITNVAVSNLTPSGYMLSINVADESKIGKIAVPVWTTNVAVETGSDEPGQDDLISGWQSICLCSKYIRTQR